MRKVNAIIERAGDGTYSIYSDAEDLDYLVTGTGKTVDEAKRIFEGGYEDMRRYYAKEGKPFTEVDMVYKYDMASFLAYYSKVISLAWCPLKVSETPTRVNGESLYWYTATSELWVELSSLPFMVK